MTQDELFCDLQWCLKYIHAGEKLKGSEAEAWDNHFGPIFERRRCLHDCRVKQPFFIRKAIVYGHPKPCYHAYEIKSEDGCAYAIESN